MRAYSLDLRERIVRAVQGGTPREVVARTFGVGIATVQRYLAQQRRTGSLAPRPIPGKAPLIGPDRLAALRAQVAATPDATLAEHCQQWTQTHGVPISVPAMHRALARLGWTRKKRRSTPPSRTN